MNANPAAARLLQGAGSTDATPAAGLSRAEAARRLARFGPNRIVERERWARIKQLVEVVADPMALMLLGSGAIYLALGQVRDGLALLVALVPVLGVDVFLNLRSREALRKLAQAVSPRVRVLRDGAEVELPTEGLVPGDLLLLREGDVVAADGVVRSCANLALDESQLTGEAEPQHKVFAAPRATMEPEEPKQPLDPRAPAAQVEAADAHFFAGSVVLAGQGLGEVLQTGARTRFGGIASLVASESGPTPLERKMRRVVRALFFAALGVALAVFALGLLRGQGAGPALLSALSLAMAAVPEEFPLVFTLFLSLGAFRLASRGVLVRRLASVETLGATTVICVDKTGTLTRGTFVLDVLVPLGRGRASPSPARGTGAVGEYANALPTPGTDDHALLEAAALACEIDAHDSIDRAVLERCITAGVAPAALHAQWELQHDYDFDPSGKHMTHVWRQRSGDAVRVVAKGALEGVLEHCDASPEERARAEAQNALLASEGVRVLAVAEGRPRSASGERLGDERGLHLLGLLGFRDPLRPEVPAAVAECSSAGIAVKMITGDHALTARAIAAQAGLALGEGAVLTGSELASLQDEALLSAIRGASVLARVRPEQKHAVVEALSRAGEIVAMTGDGINDAPALRRADIGVAMGERGTEVARSAADLVLLHDDFAALVATVREGRRIFLNLQRAFLYLIAFHVPIVGLALLAPVLGLPLLLLPIHLVWLELIVHPVSALVFEGEAAPEDVMRRPPRDPGAPLLPTRMVVRSVVSGALITATALLLYVLRLPAGEPIARGIALATLVSGSLLLVFAERAFDATWISVPLPRTARFWGVWAIAALSLPLALEVPPLSRLMRAGPLPLSDWLLALGCAAASVGWRAFSGGPRRRQRREKSARPALTGA